MSRPARTSRRSAALRRGGWAGWLGGGLLALSLAAAVALVMLPILNPPPPVDPVSGCRTDAPPPAHILVLVDASEALAARHKRISAAAVDAAKDRLPRYGRLSIVALDGENALEPDWVISLCSPGDGSDANIWTANPARLRARWQEAFAAPVEAAARRANTYGVDRDSPIAEAIRALSADPRFQDAPVRELVLVSDLMQRSPDRPGQAGVTLYDADRVFDPARDLPAKLAQVKVRVALIDRPRVSAKQATAWARFWAPWLAASGADLSAGAP